MLKNKKTRNGWQLIKADGLQSWFLLPSPSRLHLLLAKSILQVSLLN